MDFLIFFLLLSLVLGIFFHLFKQNFGFRQSSKLPPGPFPVPIIGNILQLGRKPHVSLTELSKTYGPIMYLKIGSKKAIVVSSPEMAKQILQKHDQICSGKPVPYAIQALNDNEVSLVWMSVGSKWRTLRKICKEHLFTMHKLEETKGLRQQKLQQLRNYLEECSRSGRVVNIGEVAFLTTLNLLSNTFFSMDFANFDSTSGQEIKEAIEALMKVITTPDIVDYFPIFKLIDPQGLKQKREIYSRKLLEIFDEIISKRLQLRDTSTYSPREKDLLDVLLDLNQENNSDLSHNDIKHLLLDLTFAGADSTADAVQWAIAELLRNPEKLSKTRNELKSVIGENKQVEESDIPKLPYLGAVIKENFRCHAGPFSVTHRAEADVEINGYMVPKDARIVVNIWAISRDSRIWSNPDSFEPERFLGSKIDYKGQDFEYLPFGSGRRICPGLPLAHLMLHLMVASLIHNFDWKLEGGMKLDELEKGDMFSLASQKTIPLKAFAVKH